MLVGGKCIASLVPKPVRDLWERQCLKMECFMARVDFNGKSTMEMRPLLLPSQPRTVGAMSSSKVRTVNRRYFSG